MERATYSSQGAGVCRLLRRRSFGCGGASSRATNAVYALLFTEMAARSSKAFCAACRAASRTKSVVSFLDIHDRSNNHLIRFDERMNSWPTQLN